MFFVRNWIYTILQVNLTHATGCAFFPTLHCLQNIALLTFKCIHVSNYLLWNFMHCNLYKRARFMTKSICLQFWKIPYIVVICSLFTLYHVFTWCLWSKSGKRSARLPMFFSSTSFCKRQRFLAMMTPFNNSLACKRAVFCINRNSSIELEVPTHCFILKPSKAHRGIGGICL